MKTLRTDHAQIPNITTMTRIFSNVVNKMLLYTDMKSNCIHSMNT